MPCRRSDPARQGGAALVVALLVFALCTALVVAMKLEFTRFYQRAGNIFVAEQAYAYLLGGEGLASLALLADYDQEKGQEQPRDDLNEVWAQDAAPYPLDEGGWLVGRLEDLQGRFNLNALAQRVTEAEPETEAGGEAQPRFTPAQAQFIRLLQALEEPPVSQQEAIQLTEAIADWLDRDIEPTLNGAEDDYYYGMTPSYRAANRPMASASELRAVANVTPELFRALRPWVTVWPQEPGTLNIHTAPAMVLRSINADDDLSPLTADEGQALAEQRASAGFVDLEDFLASPVFAGKAEQMNRVKTLLGQSSSYFLLDAQVEVAGRNMHLYSVLERSGRRVSAVARASGSL